MSTEPESTEDSGPSINLILRDGEAGEIVLRQIALGFQPLILIEMDQEEETLTVDSTGLGPTELAETFELLAGLIREQVPTPAESTTTEESN
ncbi:hypothetical protein FDH86_gp054 [Arthrobacter phage Tank]|uniref:Uncharacterized protein n=1 Tax=Arthrobacter phage Tank TaxID=1772319 RepID=A0A0U4B763_9CAUD|nr:hypothetical protein FDH86_gp054 [Arthrobacter phage Tank]ALY10589.1 hypothetical protein TANK_54 [Arthrobacter phage Tank]